jgi:hypothetical protein
MIEFLLALGILMLLTAGMSIGVLMGRKPIAGSCGGMAALGMEVECEICGGDTTRCVEPDAGPDAPRQTLAHDAATVLRGPQGQQVGVGQEVTRT